jgi:hypothetical protein
MEYFSANDIGGNLLSRAHAGSLHPAHFEQDTTVIFGLIRNPFTNHAELHIRQCLDKKSGKGNTVIGERIR